MRLQRHAAAQNGESGMEVRLDDREVGEWVEVDTSIPRTWFCLLRIGFRVVSKQNHVIFHLFPDRDKLVGVNPTLS